MLNLDFEAQGRGSTFNFCHGHLKKAILLHTIARLPFDSDVTIHYGNSGYEDLKCNTQN